MSTFAVAGFHDARLPAGATLVEAVVWARAAGLGPDGVDVSLRLWTPAGARVTALAEVAPGSADLLAGAARVDDLTLLADAGRWTDGVYEYELTIAVPPQDPGEELLAARVGVVAGGETAGRALIAVTWTDAALESSPTAPPGSSADLPTGAASQPPPPRGGAAAGMACAGCGALPDDGDRFCEACGRELAAG
jgi:hypothetical protein